MASLDQVSLGGTTYELVPEIAPLFDNTKDYAVGDYVIKDATLHRFRTAHAAGAWDSSHVTATDVGKTFKSIDQSTQANNSEVYYLSSLNWEQGSIDATTGEFSGNGRRIRAKLTVSNINKISADGGLFFTIFAFSGDTYVGEWNGSSWEKAAVRISGDFDATILDNYDYTFWIMGGYVDNSSINPSIGASFRIYCGKLSKTNDIISRVLLKEKTLAWEQGGYNVTSGVKTSATNRISRAIDKNMINIKVSDNVFFTILAFSGDTYVGTWNGKEFKKEACRLKDSRYIAELFDYDYTFFVMCGHDDNSTISPTDGITDVSFIVNGIDDTMNTVINRIDAITLTKINPAWWQRSINVSTGEKQTAGFRIIAELSKFCYTITAPSNMFFTVLAYSGDTYVGVWDGTTFKKEACRLKNTVSTTALRNYNYIYWIMVGYDNNNSITPDAGSSINIVVDQIEIASEKSKFAYSCSPNIIFQCRNVDDTRIPPESKWSIKAAAENQYDRVRCTVRATTGGEYFLCHDTSINNYVRNKDGSELSETVSSEGRTLAELNQYDWGIKYGPEYAGATVPLLEDFLKYSAIFNMGVTWHAGSQSAQTDAALDEQIAMIDKYGLTDNLIVISSGQKLNVLQKFVAHNPRVSCYVGGLPEYFEDASNLEIIEALQTPYNKIYVQLFPWGTAPTDEFIALSKSKNWLLYDSITMTESDLCNEDMFAKGYSLREVNNVYMVKDTLRRWANSIF